MEPSPQPDGIGSGVSVSRPDLDPVSGEPVERADRPLKIKPMRKVPKLIKAILGRILSWIVRHLRPVPVRPALPRDLLQDALDAAADRKSILRGTIYAFPIVATALLILRVTEYFGPDVNSTLLVLANISVSTQALLAAQQLAGSLLVSAMFVLPKVWVDPDLEDQARKSLRVLQVVLNLTALVFLPSLSIPILSAAQFLFWKGAHRAHAAPPAAAPLNPSQVGDALAAIVSAGSKVDVTLNQLAVQFQTDKNLPVLLKSWDERVTAINRALRVRRWNDAAGALVLAIALNFGYQWVQSSFSLAPEEQFHVTNRGTVNGYFVNKYPANGVLIDDERREAFPITLDQIKSQAVCRSSANNWFRSVLDIVETTRSIPKDQVACPAHH